MTASSTLPSLSPHIQIITKFCWLHLHNITCIHLFFSHPIVPTLVKPLSSLLDHSPCWPPASIPAPNQFILHAAAQGDPLKMQTISCHCSVENLTLALLVGV